MGFKMIRQRVEHRLDPCLLCDAIGFRAEPPEKSAAEFAAREEPVEIGAGDLAVRAHGAVVAPLQKLANVLTTLKIVKRVSVAAITSNQIAH